MCVSAVVSGLQGGGSEDSPPEGAGCEVGPRAAETLHERPRQVVHREVGHRTGETDTISMRGPSASMLADETSNKPKTQNTSRINFFLPEAVSVVLSHVRSSVHFYAQSGF